MSVVLWLLLELQWLWLLFGYFAMLALLASSWGFNREMSRQFVLSLGMDRHWVRLTASTTVTTALAMLIGGLMGFDWLLDLFLLASWVPMCLLTTLTALITLTLSFPMSPGLTIQAILIGLVLAAFLVLI